MQIGRMRLDGVFKNKKLNFLIIPTTRGNTRNSTIRCFGAFSIPQESTIVLLSTHSRQERQANERRFQDPEVAHTPHSSEQAKTVTLVQLIFP